MQGFLSYMRDFNLVTVTVRLLLALAAGGLIGYERERRGRAAGFRTHIIVCLGACMASLTGMIASQELTLDTDPMRIAAQVVSGIGFLGVGTILVTGHAHVRGLTTAAGLWTTATIGIAFGIGFYEGGLLCMLLVIIATAVLSRGGAKHRETDIYLEADDMNCVNGIINEITSRGMLLRHVEITKARSGCVANVGMNITVLPESGEISDLVTAKLSAVEHVVFAVEED